MTEAQDIEPRSYRSGLKKVRRRRWFLWVVILAYLPAMMIAFEADNPNRAAVTVFITWIVVLCIAVGFACVVRCPRCDGTFHTHGPTFIPFRHCVHCCLHVNADKQKKPSPKNQQPRQKT